MITSDFNWNAAEATASRHARVDFQERLLRKTELETSHVAEDADISARIEQLRCETIRHDRLSVCDLRLIK
jgi:hypothetical protein